MSNQQYVSLGQSAAWFCLNQSQIEKVIAGICSMCVLKIPEQSAAVFSPAQLRIILTNIDLRQPAVAVSQAQLEGCVEATKCQIFIPENNQNVLGNLQGQARAGRLSLVR